MPEIVFGYRILTNVEVADVTWRQRGENVVKRLGSVLLLIAAAMAAQQKRPVGDGMRVLTGVVNDQFGKPIPRAAVQLENEKTLEVRSYITESRGEFHFAELNPDTDYDLQAVFDQIRSPKKTLSQFDERRRPTITLVIHLPR
jgi:hypothetical protein